MRCISSLKLSYIVDERRQVTEADGVLGLPIVPSFHLAAIDKDSHFIVLFVHSGRSVNSIQMCLNSMGFNHFEHWTDCSLLQYETMSKRLKENLDIQADPQRFGKARLLSRICRYLGR
jgi:hypothetical protein